MSKRRAGADGRSKKNRGPNGRKAPRAGEEKKRRAGDSERVAKLWLEQMLRNARCRTLRLSPAASLPHEGA